MTEKKHLINEKRRTFIKKKKKWTKHISRNY